MKDKIIAVVMGGPSAEAAVSLNTGKAIAAALTELGYKIKSIELEPEKFAEQLKQAGAQVVFNAVHGLYGEDGRLQGFLDMLHIPYTGSGLEASALAMDKITSKQLFLLYNIPTPRSIVLRKGENLAKQVEAIKEFKLPVIVKPSLQGSTIGVTTVKNEEDIIPALTTAFTFGNDVLVEQFIVGREFTAAVLQDEDGAKALPVIEIVPHSGAYDYHSKYTAGATTYIVPAKVNECVREQLQDYAVRIFELFNCRGFARVDYMVDKDENIYTLEINTIPGMTSTSLVPKAAQAAGISFPELCERVLLSAGK